MLLARHCLALVSVSPLLLALALAACDDAASSAGDATATTATDTTATATTDAATATATTDAATATATTDATTTATTDATTTATTDATTTATTDATATTATDTTADETDAPDPCVGPDRDGDGLVDACDPCPAIPRVLVYDVNGSLLLGRVALDLMGCDYTVARIDDFTALLASGEFGAAVIDMPDARPEGAWTQALLDFVAAGGAVVMSSWRLDQAPSPSPLATLGASLVAELTDPLAFSPTWVTPVWTTPFALPARALQPGTSEAAIIDGAKLAPTAGRAWARFDGGGAAIVESNGGRTFLDGFLWDDFPSDGDGDSHPDVAELIANQLTAACEARLATDDGAAPEVSDFDPAEVGVVPNDLVIVRGAVDDAPSVTSRAGAEAHTWEAPDGRWKALVPLAAGDNWVTFAAETAAGPRYTHLQLRYEPQTNPRRVRFVYAIASDGDGGFDAPPGVPTSGASAALRIGLGARLIQAMFADRLAEAGLDRRTFRLVPGVTVWRTSLPTASWWAMTGLQMFSWIWDHLGDLPACTDCRTVVILGMTHWDAAQGKALAHTALGGGGLAIFGSGTLHTWAETLDDVPARLADTTNLVDQGLFDDSGYREVAWANYATGLGAVLHELGHALDLPHPTDYESLMNRGFDHVNRLLVASEPPSAVTTGLAAIWPASEPTFDFAGVHRLRWHRALALVDRPYTVNVPPTVTVDATAVHLHSAAGLRVLGWAKKVDDDWRTATGQAYATDVGPVDDTFPLESLRFLFPTEASVKLMVTDDQGNLRDDVIVPLR